MAHTYILITSNSITSPCTRGEFTSTHTMAEKINIDTNQLGLLNICSRGHCKKPIHCDEIECTECGTKNHKECAEKLKTLQDRRIAMCYGSISNSPSSENSDVTNNMLNSQLYVDREREILDTGKIYNNVSVHAVKFNL